MIDLTQQSEPLTLAKMKEWIPGLGYSSSQQIKMTAKQYQAFVNELQDQELQKLPLYYKGMEIVL